MEYYSPLKRKETLPFLTTWLNLEDILPHEISQREINTMWYHLNVGERGQHGIYSNRGWTRDWGQEEMG